MPPPNRPKSPNALLYYAAAIGAGLICAVCAALLRDMTDTKLRSLEELEQLTGAPVLGLIPAVGDGMRDHWRLWRFPGFSRAIEASLAPQVTISHFMRGPFAESLRALRTSLMLPHSSSAPQVLLITSSHSGEGKSTVSLNLATVLAQQGSRVLLVDADLRRPILHERIGLREQIGLSAALTSKDSYPPHPVEGVPNLYVVCGGDVPEFPTDLLGSHRMRALLAQWRAEYAFIVMDGPPVLPVADAVVLEQLCDAVLLVARHGVTEKKAAHRSYQSITKQLPQGVAIGAVLNAVPERSSAFYEYYGYRNRKPSGERRRNEAHI
jgi:capsular exopolysaccharide synthesis family protein